MMTGETEECFQLPLQEMSYTNPVTGWTSVRAEGRTERSKANSNFMSPKHRGASETGIKIY